jgi:hypothetical protein
MRVEIILSAEAVSHNLIHEILHAQRVAVLGIPRLVCPGNPGMSLTEALENDAEHLFMVPEEIASASEAEAFWEKQESQHLDELMERVSTHGPDESDLRAIRHGFLRLWLFVKRVLPSWPGRPALQELLAYRGWQTAADCLVDEVNKPNVDRVEVVRAFLRSDGFPLERFRLRSWSAQRLTAIKTPVPSDSAIVLFCPRVDAALPEVMDASS